MVVAFSKTCWPLPDTIVPIIDSPFPKREAVYFLGKELAGFLGCSLSLPSKKLQDKKILLLTDVLWKTEELIQEKRKVAAFFPEQVFTLALIDKR